MSRVLTNRQWGISTHRLQRGRDMPEPLGQGKAADHTELSHPTYSWDSSLYHCPVPGVEGKEWVFRVPHSTG